MGQSARLIPCLGRQILQLFRKFVFYARNESVNIVSGVVSVETKRDLYVSNKFSLTDLLLHWWC